MSKSLEERLEAHPELQHHLLELLELAESGIESADRVEEITVERIQGLGRQVIQDWATQQAKTKAQAAPETHEGIIANGKKNSTG